MTFVIDDIDAGYGRVQILHGVSVSVARGDIVALIGPNGAGKSTLLRAATGMIKATRGAVRLDGRDLTGAATETIARAGVAHVPEGRRLFPGLTVRDNLRLGGWRARNEDLSAVLTLFPPLKDRLGADGPAGLPAHRRAVPGPRPGHRGIDHVTADRGGRRGYRRPARRTGRRPRVGAGATGLRAGERTDRPLRQGPGAGRRPPGPGGVSRCLTGQEQRHTTATIVRFGSASTACPAMVRPSSLIVEAMLSIGSTRELSGGRLMVPVSVTRTA